MIKHIVSVSGGKDSSATLLIALKRYVVRRWQDAASITLKGVYRCEKCRALKYGDYRRTA